MSLKKYLADKSKKAYDFLFGGIRIGREDPNSKAVDIGRAYLLPTGVKSKRSLYLGLATPAAAIALVFGWNYLLFGRSNEEVREPIGIERKVEDSDSESRNSDPLHQGIADAFREQGIDENFVRNLRVIQEEVKGLREDMRRYRETEMEMMRSELPEALRDTLYPKPSK